MTSLGERMKKARQLVRRGWTKAQAREWVRVDRFARVLAVNACAREESLSAREAGRPYRPPGPRLWLVEARRQAALGFAVPLRPRASSPACSPDRTPQAAAPRAAAGGGDSRLQAVLRARSRLLAAPPTPRAAPPSSASPSRPLEAPRRHALPAPRPESEAPDPGAPAPSRCRRAESSATTSPDAAPSGDGPGRGASVGDCSTPQAGG